MIEDNNVYCCYTQLFAMECIRANEALKVLDRTGKLMPLPSAQIDHGANANVRLRSVSNYD